VDTLLCEFVDLLGDPTNGVAWFAARSLLIALNK
jgi:hypothetical protein